MSYDENNIFARILRGELPCHKVYEDSDTLAFLDIMPRSDGHLLVLPKTPARNMLDASPAQMTAVMGSVQKLSHAAMQAFKADGVTIQQFNEDAGGQEVYHLHVHVLPRYLGQSLRPPGVMADADLLKAQADKLRGVLGAG